MVSKTIWLSQKSNANRFCGEPTASEYHIIASIELVTRSRFHAGRRQLRETWCLCDVDAWSTEDGKIKEKVKNYWLGFH